MLGCGCLHFQVSKNESGATALRCGDWLRYPPVTPVVKAGKAYPFLVRSHPPEGGIPKFWFVLTFPYTLIATIQGSEP